MTRDLLQRIVRRCVGFLTGSAAGLLVDLIGFQLLVTVSLPPAVANVVSSATAVVVVYVLVSRFAFSARRSVPTFVAFAAWYAANIAVVSLSIAFAVATFGGAPLLWKLCSIPVSFGANYLFSTVLFRVAERRPRRATRPATSPVDRLVGAPLPAEGGS